MKFVLAFVAIVGAAVALPAPDAPLHVIPILTRSEVRDDAGQYALSYSTGNGIALAEQGALKQTPDGLDNVLVKQGSYAYTGPDGQLYKLSYVADENGFQPIADHIPIAPAVPVV